MSKDKSDGTNAKTDEKIKWERLPEDIRYKTQCWIYLEQLVRSAYDALDKIKKPEADRPEELRGVSEQQLLEGIEKATKDQIDLEVNPHWVIAAVDYMGRGRGDHISTLTNVH